MINRVENFELTLSAEELVDFKVTLENKTVHVDASNENYLFFVDKFNKARKWVYSAKVDGQDKPVPDVEALKQPKPATPSAQGPTSTSPTTS